MTMRGYNTQQALLSGSWTGCVRGKVLQSMNLSRSSMRWGCHPEGKEGKRIPGEKELTFLGDIAQQLDGEYLG